MPATRNVRKRSNWSNRWGCFSGSASSARATPACRRSAQVDPVRAFPRSSRRPETRIAQLAEGPRTRGIEASGVGALFSNLDKRLSSLADTAAVIEQLDLVITCDTSIAHLAVAMGKPVRVLLAFSADWRWLAERPDLPWYPSARLFRQPKPGDWASVMQNVAAALKEIR